MKAKKQTAYQKAMARMDREVNRAVAQVELLQKLYNEKNSKVSS